MTRDQILAASLITLLWLGILALAYAGTRPRGGLHVVREIPPPKSIPAPAPGAPGAKRLDDGRWIMPPPDFED